MFQIPGLLKYPKLFHAFSTKDEGNMANFVLGKALNFEKVLQNRRNFLTKIKIDLEKTVCMWVLGKDGVKVADSKDAGLSMKDVRRAVKIDALVTNQRQLYLFLLTADCAPIILYDPVKEALGLVHVGWKGADLNIISKVIRRLKMLYRVNPNDLIIGIGPSARAASFVKENPSQLNDPKWRPYLEETKAGKYKVDFIGLCKRELVDGGVMAENIFDCHVDTVKDGRFFSHVREGKSSLERQGRFACVVGLK